VDDHNADAGSHCRVLKRAEPARSTVSLTPGSHGRVY
jgi:hypothetical protein